MLQTTKNIEFPSQNWYKELTVFTNVWEGCNVLSVGNLY